MIKYIGDGDGGIFTNDDEIVIEVCNKYKKFVRLNKIENIKVNIENNNEYELYLELKEKYEQKN